MLDSTKLQCLNILLLFNIWRKNAQAPKVGICPQLSNGIGVTILMVLISHMGACHLTLNRLTEDQRSAFSTVRQSLTEKPKCGKTDEISSRLCLYHRRSVAVSFTYVPAAHLLFH